MLYEVITKSVYWDWYLIYLAFGLGVTGMGTELTRLAGWAVITSYSIHYTKLYDTGSGRSNRICDTFSTAKKPATPDSTIKPIIRARMTRTGSALSTPSMILKSRNGISSRKIISRSFRTPNGSAKKQTSQL